MQFSSPALRLSAPSNPGMQCTKCAILVILIGILGLVLMFIFDPTHNFPTAQATVTLAPGENYTLEIPKFGPLQYALTLLTTPYYWVESSSGGVSLLNATHEILPEEIWGFIPLNSEGRLCFYNPTNETIVALLTGTRAPTPEEIGQYKGYWWLVFGVFQMVIATIASLLKPAPTVNIRRPAVGSIGELSGQIQGEGTIASIRGKVSSLLQSCCMTRTSRGVVEMVTAL